MKNNRYNKKLFIISLLLFIVAMASAILGCITDKILNQKHYCYISIFWIIVAVYSLSTLSGSRGKNPIPSPREPESKP